VNRAVFLDRDGVINRKAPEGQYITTLEDFELLPGVAQAIASLNRDGFKVIVVSNQRCVAKGLISTYDLELMHEWMRRKLLVSGAMIDDIYYCPHDKQPPCACRKPAPGMLLAAATAHQIDLASSWMIGDSYSDIQAGRSAGCLTIQVAGSDARTGHPDLHAESLPDAVKQISLWQKALAQFPALAIPPKLRHGRNF
jgi:D-glycero-D-manno-heptose 1,7-bisphosphate phosphatase